MLTISTKRSRALNMRGFWICLTFSINQNSEYTRVLNMLRVLKIPGFWINRGSEYAKVLNIPRLWIRHWFWICQGSEYTRVLNMSGLHRVLNMPEYVWLHMSWYVWICRNMHECAQICLNGFCFIFPHCNQLTYFNVYTKLVLRKMMLFSWRYKIWIFL